MKLPLAVLASEVSLAHRAKPDACDRCCNLHNRMDLRGCCVSGPLPLLQQFWHKDLQSVDKACCWKESDGVIHIKLERTHAHARQHASSEVPRYRLREKRCTGATGGRGIPSGARRLAG